MAEKKTTPNAAIARGKKLAADSTAALDGKRRVSITVKIDDGAGTFERSTTAVATEGDVDSYGTVKQVLIEVSRALEALVLDDPRKVQS